MIARRILEKVGDGQWHSLGDVAEKLKASSEGIEGAVGVLSQLGVLVFDEKACKVKLSPWVVNLSEDDGLEGGKAAVGSVILPPKGCITIQNIDISNFLDHAVEVGVIVDKKLKEVSIGKA
jgi:hypothetical protein